ncbi:MAG TPA: endonuclease/exonuclease/phosphatase family protein [Lysobacter sp.]
MKTPALAAALVLLASACSAVPTGDASRPRGLTVASWNVEHLAERDGTGCRPRVAADYAAMRAHVERLGADVVAFQEVESEAAAERVFDPARWTVLIENRIGTVRTADCGGRAKGQTIRAQRTGFAIRKGLAFERRPDVTALQLGDADLRSGVDVVVRPPGTQPMRLLSVHLKSGCSAGDRNAACAVFFRQVPVLEQWIDARAAEGMRFAVLGDFNRRLALPGDVAWAEWDDAVPANADLARAAGDRHAQCNPRYRDFIDHIVLDRRAAVGLERVEEFTHADGAAPLSDHCAVAATLR